MAALANAALRCYEVASQRIIRSGTTDRMMAEKVCVMASAWKFQRKRELTDSGNVAPFVEEGGPSPPPGSSAASDPSGTAEISSKKPRKASPAPADKAYPAVDEVPGAMPRGEEGASKGIHASSVAALEDSVGDLRTGMGPGAGEQAKSNAFAAHHGRNCGLEAIRALMQQVPGDHPSPRADNILLHFPALALIVKLHFMEVMDIKGKLDASRSRYKYRTTGGFELYLDWHTVLDVQGFGTQHKFPHSRVQRAHVDELLRGNPVMVDLKEPLEVGRGLRFFLHAIPPKSQISLIFTGQETDRDLARDQLVARLLSPPVRDLPHELIVVLGKSVRPEGQEKLVAGALSDLIEGAVNVMASEGSSIGQRMGFVTFIVQTVMVRSMEGAISGGIPLAGDPAVTLGWGPELFQELADAALQGKFCDAGHGSGPQTVSGFSELVLRWFVPRVAQFPGIDDKSFLLEPRGFLMPDGTTLKGMLEGVERCHCCLRWFLWASSGPAARSVQAGNCG